jgi:type III restriction enzyme
MGIKVLSLFFIDEVKNYRQYDKDGREINGEYGRIFEEEYRAIEADYITIPEDAYVKYLRNIRPSTTHKGYFSIDKKTNKFINSKVSARETESDDVDAYNLIMKDKERLLSFAEPTRFIFSHSALREGWDNPNVFQICTLKHSDSTIKKRQEVGRGLRLCVNEHGDRIDQSTHGEDVHDINVLTIVASESYETFAKQLQSEIAETLTERPHKVDIKFFLDKVIENERGEQLRINESMATELYQEFVINRYIDRGEHLTEVYYNAVSNNQVAVPEVLKEHKNAIMELVSTVYDATKSNIISNERNDKTLELTDNFHKKEFQELWNRINKKSAYTVSFDSNELIEKCIHTLDTKLIVPSIRATIRSGEIKNIESKEQLEQGTAFELTDNRNESLNYVEVSPLKYDLIGKLVDETKLTRRTIGEILSRISPSTFIKFRINPEEFIIRTAKLINEEKATTVIERITYDVTSETFDASIFTQNNLKAKLGLNAIPSKRHIYNYVVTDSDIEKSFANELEASPEVCVFAKLPRGFFIPTPVGKYNPDWAVVFNEGEVKYIYFVAETKGSMESLEHRGVERAKIDCAKKHFESISSGNIKYAVIDSYEKLLDIVK